MGSAALYLPSRFHHATDSIFYLHSRAGEHKFDSAKGQRRTDRLASH